MRRAAAAGHVVAEVGVAEAPDDLVDIGEVGVAVEAVAVSYTHLDVYKRQVLHPHILGIGRRGSALRRAAATDTVFCYRSYI